MKQSATIMAALVAFATAEVPQELSHKFILTATQDLLQLNNVFEIQDSVFGLLGNAAAADGAGLVENLDCLHQITADEAFTNALALEDEEEQINGLAMALLFRSIERNTGSVGLESVLCDEEAVNPEIAALTQHQDPAADGAADLNKAITLELAVQLASIGADPTLALLAGTFAPGEIGDPTGAGNTCDDDDDEVGCIFTGNLLVPDASIEEINAAVEDAGIGAAADEEDAAGVNELAALLASGGISALAGEASAIVARQNNAGVNLQSFAGDLGGAAPEVVDTGDADRPFEVNGATFQSLGAALERSCAVQNNACSDAANAGEIEGGTGQCGEQEAECKAGAEAAKSRRKRSLRFKRSVSTKFKRARATRTKRTKAVKARQNNALDFGACADPSIVFEEGLDGRAEAAFAPANSADFSQGSANNVNIITSFICGQLGSACEADEAAVAACEEGQAAADGLEAQEAVDAFNGALGL